jgi:flagellar motor switch protein FliN/FliY
MANQQKDIIQGNGDKDRVLPLSFGSINSGAVATRRPITPLSTGGVLPFNAMLDVPIQIVFEVGRTTITIKQLMELNKGSFVELRQVSVDTIDVRINDRLFGYGETIALQTRYGIRFGELDIRAGVDDAEA